MNEGTSERIHEQTIKKTSRQKQKQRKDEQQTIPESLETGLRNQKMKPKFVENSLKMEPRGANLIKNGAKRSKLDQKWSQEEQKLEADRTRWPKTAPKSRPRGPTRAMVHSWGSKMEAQIDQNR